MLAVGAGKEFKPLWDKEMVREVLKSSTDSLSPLKDSFVAFATNKATERELINTIIRSMGYTADAKFESEYEEGVLFTAHQVLAELGEKVPQERLPDLLVANCYGDLIMKFNHEGIT